MAAIQGILFYSWPGALYTMADVNDYDTLVWFAESTAPKPTEAEILALNDEVDAQMELNVIRQAHQDNFLNDINRPDRLLYSFEALLAAVIDLRIKAQVSQPLDTIAGLDDLDAAIATARAAQP
jgi:hypothetical protein